MPSNIFFVALVNLVLAFIIYANAEFGRMLGIQGQALAISVVWPATGFSLAALLLFGLRLAPGVFLGNFAYNFIYLWPQASHPFTLITAIIISLGSLIQAIVGYKIMQKYASSEFFATAKDIFVFLLPAGILTCLIASTIGVTALYFFQPMTLAVLKQLWLTFWVGDTMGVYVFTPLLIVWTLLKPEIDLEERLLEIGAFLFILALTTYLTFFQGFRLLHLYIPLCVWAAYRFKMHGATLAIFLITLAIVLPTSIGFGPFLERSQNALLYLISFLEMIVPLALILGVLVTQRDKALNQFRSYSMGLKHTVEMNLEELQEKDAELFVHEKQATLSTLTSNIAKQMQEPLRRIDTLTKVGLGDLSELNKLFIPIEDKLSPELASDLQTRFNQLENYLTSITKAEKQANHIAHTLQEYTNVTSHFEIKSVDVNALVQLCLDNAVRYRLYTYPLLEVDFVLDLDKAVILTLAMPQNLASALYHLITHAIDSLSLKEQKDFVPRLEISTLNLDDKILITLRDDGQGIRMHDLKEGFSLLEGTYKDNINLPLSIAHDLVKYFYRGEFKITSTEGEFTEISILLPKSLPRQR